MCAGGPSGSPQLAHFGRDEAFRSPTIYLSLGAALMFGCLVGLLIVNLQQSQGAAWAEWISSALTQQTNQGLTWEGEELEARTEVLVRFLRSSKGRNVMPLSAEVVESVREVLTRFTPPAGSELSTTEFARRKKWKMCEPG